MGWQFWTGTGVFVGTIVILLYVRWRATTGRLSRSTRRVLVALARDVGQSVSTTELRRRVDASPTSVRASLVDLVSRGFVVLDVSYLPVDDFHYERYELTARGVIEAQRGARGQHGRHR